MISGAAANNGAPRYGAHSSRAKHRLNRDFGQTRFGDAGDTLEELAAELASAFFGATIGLPANHLENHPSYIGGWVKAMSDYPSAFLTVTSKAQAAADWVLREMGIGRLFCDNRRSQ